MAIKKGRQKTVYTCGACRIQGNNETDQAKKIDVIPQIPCGYCKGRVGRSVYHILCNECFMRGCLVMNPPTEYRGGVKINLKII